MAKILAQPLKEILVYYTKLFKWVIKHKKGEAPPKPPIPPIT